MATAFPYTLPNLDQIFPGVPSKRETPRPQQDFLPNKNGGSDGFESQNSTIVYKRENDIIQLATLQVDSTRFVSIDAKGARTVTPSHSTESMTLIVNNTVYKLEHAVDGGKESFSVNGYQYTVENGKVTHTLNGKKISDKEFADGVNATFKTIASVLPESEGKAMLAYATALKQATEGKPMQPHAATLQTAVAMTASVVAPASAHTVNDQKDPIIARLHAGDILRISTDGHQATLQAGNIAETSNYRDKQKPDQQNKPIPSSFAVDTFMGGPGNKTGVDSDFMRDQSLRNALPESVRKQVAQAIREGVIVYIDHTSGATAAEGPAPAKNTKPHAQTR